MATRSRIGIKNPDGTIVSVYCHWDGYLSNNGRILLNSYNHEDYVYELMTKGDMSFLDDSVSNCKFYEDSRAIAHKSEDEFIKEGEDYNYLFKDGKWYYNKYSVDDFKELTIVEINKDL